MMDDFERFLSRHSDDRILVVTPGGNHGDTLIHLGLEKKLRELRIDYKTLNLEVEGLRRPSLGVKYLLNIASWRLGLRRIFKLLDTEGFDLLLFEGGGYMSDLWYGPVLMMEAVRMHDKPIAVAPQSYWFRGEGFRELLGGGRPITLFCREPYSYRHLLEMELPPSVEVHVSDDTSLYLEPGDLERYIQPRRGGYDLVCFRGDRESAISEALKRSILAMAVDPLVGDISKRRSFEEFISTVAHAERVYTDRLHVAILAALLRRDTLLIGVRYHKNLGVYEYSLRRFPWVRYVEAEGDLFNVHFKRPRI